MILNIGIFIKPQRFLQTALFIVAFWLGFKINAQNSDSSVTEVEPVQACVFDEATPLTLSNREQIARCLGWVDHVNRALCRGDYANHAVISSLNESTEINADSASLYLNGRSQLAGHVTVHADDHIISADTAYLLRDAKTHQIQRIELLGQVHYSEPNRDMWARFVEFNPEDKTGQVLDVLYRIKNERAAAILPAWGLARFIQRFVNQDLLLKDATYTTCPPYDKQWLLRAREIKLDYTGQRAVARDVTLTWHDWPLLYTPYLTFPTSKARKSGFLMPTYGYTNLGGFDISVPYYWNMAPNYDATLLPRAYTERGLMLGADWRGISAETTNALNARFLPADKAYHHFLTINKSEFPQLDNQSDNRWMFAFRNESQFNPQWSMYLNYQRVSDDYYLQDFNNNLVLTTENQLQQLGVLRFRTDHWLLQGTAESYQTLNPINQAAVSPIYQRLPQVLLEGGYDELPFNARFNWVSQYDQFAWPADYTPEPEGPRVHVQPTFSIALRKPWGYVQPQVELIENYYQLSAVNQSYSSTRNWTIPRYSVDSGLFFEREGHFFWGGYTQTLEPRLYYLNVPAMNQSFAPSYDSAYMIFSTEQLFRANRFSGIDRIGDANQLAYAVTSRWLTQTTGREFANVTVGQLRYFKDRNVQLCYQVDGLCTDSPLILGYLSPTAVTSPIASSATVHLNSIWSTQASWVWDTATRATNNTAINFEYQPELNHILSLGYSYLVSGNVLDGANRPGINTPLHQATVGGAWPLNPHWSLMGIYSYNVSEQYDMISFLGTQYDSCCWAFRLLGGRVFDSLSPNTIKPHYNNNAYVQIVLKGLGSAGNSDSSSIIQSYLPGYVNPF